MSSRKKIEAADDSDTLDQLCIFESDVDHTAEDIQSHKRLHVAANVVSMKFGPTWRESVDKINAQIQCESEDTRSWIDAQKASSKLLRDIRDTCGKFAIKVPNDEEITDAIIPCYTRHVLSPIPNIYLSLARVCCKLEQHSESISNASLGLVWSRQLDQPSTCIIYLLHARACGHNIAGDLQSAVEDADAAWAATKSYGDEFELSNQFILSAAVEARVQIKLQERVSRPHYSPAEADTISRKLGIGIYSDAMKHCWNCGAHQPEEKKLRICSSCLLVWYCSKKCQQAHRSAHKHDCKTKKVTFTPLISPSMKSNIEQDISDRGYSCIGTAMYGPLTILRDSSTGALFDSVHNLDMVVEDDPHDDPCSGCANCGHKDE